MSANDRRSHGYHFVVDKDVLDGIWVCCGAINRQTRVKLKAPDRLPCVRSRIVEGKTHSGCVRGANTGRRKTKIRELEGCAPSNIDRASSSRISIDQILIGPG